MSYSKRLSDIFNALKPIYHSVEIRTAFVLENQTNGLSYGQKISRWLDLFTIIRFKSEIISEFSYKILMDGSKVKFVIWNYPFEKIWNRLVDGFAGQIIVLNQISQRVEIPFSITISTKFDLLGQNFHSYPVYQENYNEEWPVMMKMFKTSSSDQARNIFRNDFEISRYLQSENYENPEMALKEFLQLNIPPDQTDNLHLIFEIPFKISAIKMVKNSSDSVNLNVDIVSDGIDVKDLTVNVRQKINSKAIYKKSHSLIEANKQVGQDRLLIWKVEDQLKNDLNSQIEVDLFHKDIGIIENQVKNFKDFFDSIEKNPPSFRQISNEAVLISEITSGLEKFRIDFPEGKRTAFIMMQFEESKQHKNILNCLKQTLEKNKITGLRADYKEYMDDLFLNIKTYMHACDFGIAVFERITEENFNPNVSLEVGYMLGLGKNVLLLKDQTLKSLHADLVGKLYKPFNTSEVDKTLPDQITKWISDKGFSTSE